MRKSEPHVPIADLAYVNPIDRIPATGKVPFIAMEDVSEDGQLLRIGERDSGHVSGCSTFRNGDTLFAKITPCLENGKGAHVSGLDGLGAGSTEFHVLRPRHDVNSRYLFHWMRYPALRQAAESRMIGSAGQRRVPAGFFRSFRILRHTVGEQRRIAEVLDATDNSIESARLEMAKRGVLADAMMRILLNSIDHSKSVFVGDFYSIATGLTLGPYRQALTRTAPYLRVANVQRGRLDLAGITSTGIQQTERDRYSLRVGDLLVVEGHADPDQIGRCAQVDDVARGFLYQNHLFRLRSLDIAPEFGLAWLNSDTARAYWRANCATSSGLYTINGSLLAHMPMPVVSSEIQNQVVSLLRASNVTLKTAADTLEKLRMVKKGLMGDLLTGKVRVGELPG